MIPCAGPSITEKEISLVTEAIRDGWYANGGKYTSMFDEEFRKYIGTKYVLSLMNCTSAIHLAMIAMGVKAGDEVIVPECTWPATSAPIVWLGAKPIFVDIDRYNWCMDPDRLENAINDKTKLIVPVDLYGNSPEWDEIIDIAKFNDVPILEDSCESLGSEYYGKKIGRFGKASVFSFAATKLLTGGRGGVLATDDKEIYEKAKSLAHHGLEDYSKKIFWSKEVGYNYGWCNLEAACALGQLRRLDELIAMKKKYYDLYVEYLEGVDHIFYNPEEPHKKNVHWMFNVIDDRKRVTKETVMKKLREKNIDSRPMFYPLSSMPAYGSQDLSDKNRVAYDITRYGVNLPSSMKMTENDIEYICRCYKDILRAI